MTLGLTQPFANSYTEEPFCVLEEEEPELVTSTSWRVRVQHWPLHWTPHPLNSPFSALCSLQRLFSVSCPKCPWSCPKSCRDIQDPQVKQLRLKLCCLCLRVLVSNIGQWGLLSNWFCPQGLISGWFRAWHCSISRGWQGSLRSLNRIGISVF